jgi:hypothetical protein
MRKKILIVSILFLVFTFSFAQQASTNNKKALADAAWAQAGCGPDDIHFDVKMDKSQNALAQPASGKALVYVFEDDLTTGGFPTTRVGLDGKWAGANIPDSYFLSAVTPGAHRLCSNWQGHPKMGAARDLTFEDGKIYFFRVTIAASGNEAFILDQVPEAEGHFLIATHRLSTSSAKPQNGDE